MAGVAAMPARAGLRVVAWSLRLSLALVVVAAFATLVLWMRLSAGPLELPWLATMLVDRFNQASQEVHLEADAVVLSLGEAGQPAGVALISVRLNDAGGTPLLSVPRVAARFHPSDLILGRLQPTEITVSGAAARVVRTEDGRVRFALRDGEAGPGRAPSLRGEGRSMDAVAQIFDGFVGDKPPVPQLARLQSVSILDADLTYRNAATGRSWQSDRAELELRRTPDGAALTVDLALVGTQGDAAPAATALTVSAERTQGEAAPAATALTVSAERTKGAGATRVHAEFTDIQPGHLAEEVPEVGWLSAIDARLSGSLAATLSDDGSVGALQGSLRAADGRLLAVEEEGLGFESFALNFGYDPATRRMQVEQIAVESPVADLDLSGFADLSADAEGRVVSVAGQLDIASLRVALPEVFEEEQSFHGGQIVARVDLDARTIEVADARLHQGPLTLSVSGRIAPRDNGWTTDLRVSGHDIAAARLIGLWPLRTAKGARRWLAKHLKGGTVDEMVAHLRLGEAEPRLSLDFGFSGVETTFLKEMTPIEGGSGRGHMTWSRLDIEVEEGVIEPLPGQPIDIAGSRIAVRDIWGKPARGEIDIAARGPTAAVLALIDQEPLNLAAKANIAPRQVAGSAVVDTALRLPLDKEVRLADVEVDASATLSSLRMPFRLDLTGPMTIAAGQVELTATGEQMIVAGAITADGTPLRLDWEERFGGPAKGRDVALSGRATPAVLEGFNLAIPGFDGGSAPFELDLVQAPGSASRFDLTADLTPAAVTVEPVFWTKSQGLPAQATVEGVFDKRLTLEQFALTGPGLEAEGSLRLFPGGGVEQASVRRLELGPLADLTVEVAARAEGAGGGFALDIGGRWFDLAFLDQNRNPAVPPVTPLVARYAVDKVKVSEQITLGLVRGDFSRQADGRLAADLTGQVGGTAPVAIRYGREPGQPGKARVTASDAGRVLDAAGVFAGARGGRLVLNAAIAPEPGTSFEGTAIIQDVVVRQEAQTLRRVLEEGELGQVAQEAGQGGLSFQQVEVPFRFRGDRIEIDTALASSPSLAIKASGVVNEATRALNMRGVISPAYALTGALNSIPLIGTLLGGKGEGVLAMTFSVTGSASAPRISVNPLSLLAPGFLRNIFEGDALSEAAPPIPALSTASRLKAAEERATPPPRRSVEQEAAAAAEQRTRLQDLLDSDL